VGPPCVVRSHELTEELALPLFSACDSGKKSYAFSPMFQNEDATIVSRSQSRALGRSSPYNFCRLVMMGKCRTQSVAPCFITVIGPTAESIKSRAVQRSSPYHSSRLVIVIKCRTQSLAQCFRTATVLRSTTLLCFFFVRLRTQSLVLGSTPLLYLGWRKSYTGTTPTFQNGGRTSFDHSPWL